MPQRKNALSEKLAGFASALGQIAGSVGEVVSSAGELLVDADLRRKGAQYIVQEASRGINEAQRGLEASADALGRSIQQGAKARLGAGARQLQSVLRNIERQVQEFQRQQQQRDMLSEVEHHHKLPVDIQIGDQVFEDMPQEMRSRFWYVLLERPDLALQLLGTASTASTGAGGASSSQQHSGSGDYRTQQHGQQQDAGASQPAAAGSCPHKPQGDNSQAMPAAAAAVPGVQVGSPVLVDGSSLASPFAAVASHTPGPLGSSADGLPAGPTLPPPPPISSSSSAADAAGPAAAAGRGASDTQQQQQQQQRAAEDSIPDIDDLLSAPSTSGDCSSSSAVPAGGVSSSHASAAAAAGAAGTAEPTTTAAAAAAEAAAEAQAAAVLPKAPSPWTSGHNETSLDPPVTAVAGAAAAAAAAGAVSGSSAVPLAPSPWEPPPAAAVVDDVPAPPSSAAAAVPAASLADGDQHPGAAADTAAPPAAAAAAGGPAPAHSAADGEGWELVSRDVPALQPGSTGDLEALETVRTLVELMSEEASLDGQRAVKQAVFQAMLEVPWVAGEGIPDSPTNGTQYAELLEAGCGSIEEVILRDVPRTFPEHPLFSTAAGQQKLLRVLKAYAAVDPEVGYCQGMAFAAGVLLMYMPEEPAFRLFQRLMSPEGPNLRRYYLPGLDYLKLELSCFELLLSSHQPQLHQHLLDAGLPALLYAAQWLMTTYACPFPIHVAARVLDVLLQSDSDAMLPRLGLAVMEALSSRLLELDDFEELITYLKVKPLSWPLHTHRKVFAAALQSAATDAELQAASAAAREEFQRSGRVASFSSKHLSRQATLGGTTRHELKHGPMGPKTQAATEAAAAMACHTAAGAGVDADAGLVGGVSSRLPEQGADDADGGGSGAGSSRQRQLSGRPSSTHDAVLVGPAGSGIVVDEDALEDLITDLDLLLPGGMSDETESDIGSPEPAGAAVQVPKQDHQQHAKAD